MKIYKNKRGDKIISVYWFAILFIVAAAIVYMVLTFYGKPYDVREAEANVLIDQVADCFVEGGYLKGDFSNYQQDFSEKCNLNFDVEDVYDWKEKKQYYLEINLYDMTEDDSISEIILGDGNLKDYCALQENKKQEKLPFCLEKKFYTLDRNNNQFIIKILAVLDKTEKNVL